MIKILKYLKNSIISVIAIIALLCLQAAADLELPDYTSKIVNVGIQQGGIENSSPEVIRKSQMDNLLIFTDADNDILNKYSLITKNSKKEDIYIEYTKKYSNLEEKIENEDIYVLNKISKEDQKELNKIIAKPLMTLSSINSEEYSGMMKQQILENVPEPQKTMMSQMELIDIIYHLYL